MFKQLRKKIFYSQGKMPLNQITPNPYYTHYMLPKTGQAIFETTINTDLGGETVEIAVANDIHINYFTKEDESNEELMLTKKCRAYNADGAAVPSVIGAMDVGEFADQMVLAGDILDFMSAGTMEHTKKYIFDRNPGVLGAVGSHDFSRQVQTGVRDKTSSEYRMGLLNDFWIHDIHYTAKDIKNKVICVILDNSLGTYYKGNAEKLKAEVERARKENKIILLFQHEPVSTGRPTDEVVDPYYDAYNGKRNFYSGPLVFSKAKEMKEEDKLMYEVLKESTDVIKGIFCGHLHSLFYTELTFETEEGKKVIPQYTCVGNTYFGYRGVVTRVFIK